MRRFVNFAPEASILITLTLVSNVHRAPKLHGVGILLELIHADVTMDTLRMSLAHVSYVLRVLMRRIFPLVCCVQLGRIKVNLVKLDATHAQKAHILTIQAKNRVCHALLVPLLNTEVPRPVRLVWQAIFRVVAHLYAQFAP